jgi:hypothetical protein
MLGSINNKERRSLHNQIMGLIKYSINNTY